LPSITSDPILAVAMGAPLACLLAEAGPPPIVLAASTASGLDVGVFLADDGTELEMARVLPRAVTIGSDRSGRCPPRAHR
jgi:hypothetical protein